MVVGPESSNPLPVVMAYHGFTKDAAYHRAISGLAEEAVERGFIVVFPEGTIPEDGTRPYFNIGTNDDESLADDIGFTEEILDQLEEEYCITTAGCTQQAGPPAGCLRRPWPANSMTGLEQWPQFLVCRRTRTAPIDRYRSSSCMAPQIPTCPIRMPLRTTWPKGPKASGEARRRLKCSGVSTSTRSTTSTSGSSTTVARKPPKSLRKQPGSRTKYQDCGVETAILEEACTDGNRIRPPASWTSSSRTSSLSARTSSPTATSPPHQARNPPSSHRSPARTCLDLHAAPRKEKHQKGPDVEKPPLTGGFSVVGATGIEPVTSAVSRQKRRPSVPGLSPKSRCWQRDFDTRRDCVVMQRFAPSCLLFAYFPQQSPNGCRHVAAQEVSRFR